MHICGTALERSAHYKEAIQAYTAALEENNLGVQKDKKTIWSSNIFVRYWRLWKEANL